MPSALEVRCTVSNCYFWAQENYCGANQIIITADQQAGPGLDNAAVENALSQMAETPVQTSRVTCCQTFRQH